MDMIDTNSGELSLRAQFTLLNLSKSSYYYQAIEEKEADQNIANLIHELWLKHPFYGYRKITAVLRRGDCGQGKIIINHKKVQRLMKEMNLAAIFPKKKTKWQKEDKSQQYPYLLKDLAIIRINQVWITDITYIRMNEGFTYFITIVDLFSRFILSSYLSTSLEAEFCIETLKSALSQYSKPEIFNTDQGTQFTSFSWCELLQEKQIKISMDGKGRCFDNIHQERLWRTVKYEEVYLKDYETVTEAKEQLAIFVEFYNHERPHQSLNYKTPAEIYFADKEKEKKIVN